MKKETNNALLDRYRALFQMAKEKTRLRLRNKTIAMHAMQTLKKQLAKEGIEFNIPFKSLVDIPEVDDFESGRFGQLHPRLSRTWGVDEVPGLEMIDHATGAVFTAFDKIDNIEDLGFSRYEQDLLYGAAMSASGTREMLLEHSVIMQQFNNIRKSSPLIFGSNTALNERDVAFLSNWEAGTTGPIHIHRGKTRMKDGSELNESNKPETFFSVSSCWNDIKEAFGEAMTEIAEELKPPIVPGTKRDKSSNPAEIREKQRLEAKKRVKPHPFFKV